MLPNRSMPACTVIPELGYPDVARAVAWLCAAFGFTVRLTIADHRAQLNVGDGAIVVTRADPHDETHAAALLRSMQATHAVMVRVADVDAHHAQARAAGAAILGEPADQPYGERQYTTRDPGGHLWTFSQSIADVAPEEWGGRMA
jgi:uncharacterized glyoxalase superfamily protein PhnB